MLLHKDTQTDPPGSTASFGLIQGYFQETSTDIYAPVSDPNVATHRLDETTPGVFDMRPLDNLRDPLEMAYKASLDTYFIYGA